MSKSSAFLGLAFILAACAAPVSDPPSESGSKETSAESLKLPAPKPLDVTFTDCEDTAGITPVSREVAARFVPSSYTMSGTTTASFIVRLANCGGVSVEGSRAVPGTVVQVGVTVVAPDGNTANINNYTDWYYTDNLDLAVRLELLGVHTEWVPDLRYSYEENAEKTGGSLLVNVPGHPALTIAGEVAEPTVAPVVYVSNWWADGFRGRVDMNSYLPSIAFGTAPGLTITTPHGSQIAELLGADSAVFASFHSFSRSTPETMKVTVATP